jgi:hypothetical protein
MEFRGKLAPILIATCVMWLTVAGIWVAIDMDIVRAAAAILGLFAMIVIWPMWALNEYGINVDGTSHEKSLEKAKRDTASSQDARWDLLFSLLTPDERDALRSRLVEELEADGEAVSLADLLSDQDSHDAVSGHTS